MTGIRDDSAGNYGQWINDPDQPWLDYIAMKGSDIGGGAYNALANITGALSPIGTSPEGNMSLQVPPMITGIADSYRRLSDPTGPGNAYRLTGVPELDAPIQKDMSDVLLSFTGGQAIGGLGRAALPKRGMNRIERTVTDYDFPMYRMTDNAGTEIARAQFDELPNAVRVKDLFVDPSHRGQGVASTLYGHIQDDLVKPMTPDYTLTPDGFEFWKNSYPEAVADYRFDGQTYRQPGPLRAGAETGAVESYRMSGGPNRDRNVLWSDTGKPSIFGSALATAGEQPRNALGAGAFGGTPPILDRIPAQFAEDIPPVGRFPARGGARMDELLAMLYPKVMNAPGTQVMRNGEMVKVPPLNDLANAAEALSPYDISALDQAWRNKTKQTGELFSDTGRPSIFGSALATAGEQPRGMTLYHGSPHDFDKFSLEKIGTGEGNQAFGRGVYLASNEDVAKYYRDTLAPDGGGHMYKVDINAPDEAFMDMSKGLSEQSDHVRNALLSDRVTDQIRKQYGVEEYDGRYLVRTPSGSMSAKTLEEAQRYADDLAKTARADKSYADFNAPYLIGTRTADFPELADALRESGIAGAKYFDQHSRLADEGNQTMNYVVYDDSLIDILKKYGIAGGAVGAGAMAQPDSASADDLPDWLKF